MRSRWGTFASMLCVNFICESIQARVSGLSWLSSQRYGSVTETPWSVSVTASTLVLGAWADITATESSRYGRIRMVLRPQILLGYQDVKGSPQSRHSLGKRPDGAASLFGKTMLNKQCSRRL